MEKGARNAVVSLLSCRAKTGSSVIGRAGVEAFALLFGKTDLSGDIIMAAGTTVARAAYERVDLSRFLEAVSAVVKRIVDIRSDANPFLKDTAGVVCCHDFAALSDGFEALVHAMSMCYNCDSKSRGPSWHF